MQWFMDSHDIFYELALDRIPCHKNDFKILDLNKSTLLVKYAFKRFQNNLIYFVRGQKNKLGRVYKCHIYIKYVRTY